MNQTESVATRVARRALDLHDRLVERLNKEAMTPPIGMQEVSTRRVRVLIRQALAGDQWAMSEVQRLALINGHQPLEPEPCPVCRQIAAVLGESNG